MWRLHGCGSGEWQKTDINDLVDQALSLSYHGARAQDQSFSITLEREFDPAVVPIEVVRQDVTRVFLNLLGNGFYAATRKAHASDAAPVLKVTTRELGNAVEIRVHDNGIGIPPENRDKLFQPFFTTKPTGEGTGQVCQSATTSSLSCTAAQLNSIAGSANLLSSRSACPGGAAPRASPGLHDCQILRVTDGSRHQSHGTVRVPRRAP